MKDAKLRAEKDNFREQVKDLKTTIDEAEMQESAKLVFSKIELLPEFVSAKTIFIYWSLADELPTHEFIQKWSSIKEIVLPAVCGPHMILKKYDGTKNLIEGELGISEPNSDTAYNGKIDLIIVPGIAFDRSKNRLGRGKGFYDRYFQHKDAFKVGICFDFQLFDSIPFSDNDVKMDKIISSSDIV